MDGGIGIAEPTTDGDLEFTPLTRVRRPTGEPVGPSDLREHDCHPRTPQTPSSRPRRLNTDQTASIVMRGHTFMRNLQRSYYALGIEARTPHRRVAAAFDELASMI